MAIGGYPIDDCKEVIAVSSIQNEIRSSVLSYLLAASPRSGGNPPPITPTKKTYTKAQSTVLSPWNGCISHSLEIPSPRSCLGTPKNSSPELGSSLTAPSGGVLRYSHSLSPTRKRLHNSPPQAEEACLASDVRLVPDLEEDLGRTGILSGAGFCPREAKVDVDSLGAPSVSPSFLALAKASITERKVSSPKVGQALFTTNRPPRPPGRPGRVSRLALSLSGKEGQWRGPLGEVQVPQTLGELVDNPPFSLLACLLLLCFTVLIVFGGNQR